MISLDFGGTTRLQLSDMKPNSQRRAYSVMGVPQPGLWVPRCWSNSRPRFKNNPIIMMSVIPRLSIPGTTPGGYPEYPDPLRGGFCNRGHELSRAHRTAGPGSTGPDGSPPAWAAAEGSPPTSDEDAPPPLWAAAVEAWVAKKIRPSDSNRYFKRGRRQD